MFIWRLVSSGGFLPLAGRMTAAAMAVVLLAAATAGGACGGEDEPAQEFFSRSSDVIRRLVPEASAFSLKVYSPGGDSGTLVEFTIATDLDGQPRMHVISDEDAVAGAAVVEEYGGFKVYQKKDTFWAELVTAPPPLYAGTPDQEGVKAYIDFYRSGKPRLTDERFWHGFDYAQERMGGALEEAPPLMTVNFDSGWQPGVGGLRFEATFNDRRLLVAVLYEGEDGQSGDQEFDEAVVEAFKERFAVPAEADEQPENPDWGYAHRIWVMDAAPGTPGGGQ